MNVIADPPPVPAEVVETLNSWKRIVVVGHVVPDADCLGSMLALAMAWGDRSAGHVSCALPDGSVSQRLRFIVDAAQVPLADAAAFAEADGFAVVDTAKKSRCNVGRDRRDSWSDGRRIVNIDHHTSNTEFGDVNWVVSGASSTSELIAALIRHTERPLDPAAASLLYAGLYTDTVGFSLPTTTDTALQTAAWLVERGADVGMLGEKLSRSQRPSEFNLLRTIYANTHLTADNRIAYSTATFEEIAGAGCSAADIDEQVTVPRSLDGIRLALLFTEGNKGKTRINLRGESHISVLELARELGGGGHDQAAGAVLNCGIADAVQRVLPLAVRHLDGQTNQNG